MKRVLLALVLIMLFSNVAMAWWPSSASYGTYGVWDYWGPGYTIEWYGG